MRLWQRRTEDAFLNAYLDTVAGHAGAPAREVSLRLVRFFTLEKVLYEVRYELGNRPDWVQIPLDGLLELLGTAS